MEDIEDQDISDVISRARILTQNKPQTTIASASEHKDSEDDRTAQSSRRIQCYYCNGPHLARFCRKGGRMNGGSQFSKIVCYRCNKVGHIQSQCREEVSGNDKRVVHAPATTRAEE
jgi:hypothetical protein